MNNVMLDLETLGNGNNAAIVSIGAVMFDPYHNAIGSEFYIEIEINSAAYYGQMDASTVQWWMGQSDEARALFTNKENKQPLKTALIEFQNWIDQTGEFKGRIVWGNGSCFDNVILGNAFKALKLHQPWPFYGDRDVRTIVDLGKQLRAINPKKDIPFIGVAHNALDDAKHQARYVSAIYGALKTTNTNNI